MRPSFFQKHFTLFLLVTLFVCPAYAGTCISKKSKTDYSVSQEGTIASNRQYRQPLRGGQSQRRNQKPMRSKRKKSRRNDTIKCASCFLGERYKD